MTPSQEVKKTTLRTAARAVIGIYILGCLLLYFGIPNAVIEFFSTHTWNLKPERDLVPSLVDAAVTLARPFLAVVLTFWAVAIPPAIVLGIWCWGTDIARFCKRLSNREQKGR